MNPTKPCTQCGHPVEITKVVSGETGKVTWQGWICGHCGHFERPIGRERGFCNV